MFLVGCGIWSAYLVVNNGVRFEGKRIQLLIEPRYSTTLIILTQIDFKCSI